MVIIEKRRHPTHPHITHPSQPFTRMSVLLIGSHFTHLTIIACYFVYSVLNHND